MNFDKYVSFRDRIVLFSKKIAVIAGMCFVSNPTYQKNSLQIYNGKKRRVCSIEIHLSGNTLTTFTEFETHIKNHIEPGLDWVIDYCLATTHLSKDELQLLAQSILNNFSKNHDLINHIQEYDPKSAAYRYEVILFYILKSGINYQIPQTIDKLMQRLMSNLDSQSKREARQLCKDLERNI